MAQAVHGCLQRLHLNTDWLVASPVAAPVVVEVRGLCLCAGVRRVCTPPCVGKLHVGLVPAGDAPWHIVQVLHTVIPRNVTKTLVFVYKARHGEAPHTESLGS